METTRSNECVKTTCPYCGVGCGLNITSGSDSGYQISGTANHPANLGRLCVKGAALHETLDTSSRLLEPQINGETSSWEDALSLSARKLRDIIDTHGPDAVAFYVSGQLLTEDYYVANKLMKGFIGSANIDTNSRLCMSSAVAGHKRAFGSDTVPCDYTDLEEADLIIIAGSNTAWAHPVIYQRIVDAKRKRPLLRIVTIDPRRTNTSDISDLHLSLKPNSDAALFSGLLIYLEQNGCLDKDFIASHTRGLADTLSAAISSVTDMETLACLTGLDKTTLLEFYKLFAQHEKTVTLFSQGLNQSCNGTDNANAVINCHLATGRIGKPGTGPFSITGQPNAMGGREVGGLANQLAAHMDFGDSEALDRVRRFWRAENLAQKPGLKAIDLFNEVAAGNVRAIWIMGTNPAVSMPQAEQVTRALKDCELVIVSDCEAKTDTTECANILFPALAWGEKSGTVTNSERRISRQRAFLDPPGNTRADWWIMTQVAKHMGFGSAFNYTSSAQIFREHAALSCFENHGNRDFDIGGLAELSDEAYENLKPTQWPYAKNKDTTRLYADGHFFTDDGRARFVPLARLPAPEQTHEFPYTLNSGRLRDQWHTMTRTGKSARLLQHTDEPFVEIHPTDADRERISDGDLMALLSESGSSFIAKAKLSERQKPQSLFVPIHWSTQLSASAKASALSTALSDPFSGQPGFKHAKTAIQKLEIKWRACIITASQHNTPDCSYWCKIPGVSTQRLELAGEKPLTNLEAWLRDLSGAHGTWMVYQDKKLGTYRTACTKDGKLQAAIYYTESGTLPERTGLQQLFEIDTSPESSRAVLAGKHVAAVDLGPIICACHATGEKSIRRAIEKTGCRSVYSLGEKLNCGTGCGSCVPELKAILAEYDAAKA